MQKRHRIFIAINLPEDIKRGLSEYQEKWPELPAKWTAKDNLHITLEFLGDLTDEELGNVCKAVGKVTLRHKIFSVNLNKILYGPPKKMPPCMVCRKGGKIGDLTGLEKKYQELFLKEKNLP